MSRQVISKVFFIYLFALLCLVFHVNGYFSSISEQVNRNCFCELKGSINDCSCNIDTVDHFNNVKIYPRLQSLLVKNFFRFYQVNLKHECPFWVDDSKCAMRFCHVESCEPRDIPIGLKADEEQNENAGYKYSEYTQYQSDCAESGENDDLNKELSFINTSISEETHGDFEKWAQFDEADEDFCIIDNSRDGAEYVDLLLNPERYTGYKGESAHRIWRTIYMENCFGNNNKNPNSYIPHANIDNICLEQRAFYRIISGLHTSINIHLCSKYLLDESQTTFLDPKGVWGHNTEEFKQRFSSETTNDQGPQWLKNLYFIYLVELRALSKAASYLESEHFYTGIQEDDNEVRTAMKDLMGVVKSFPSHFNESLMFSSGLGSIKLKNDFRDKFRNISRIMDCVGCDKCRLWGKLQTQGLGTALKILFSEKLSLATEKGHWDTYSEQSPIFKLTRTEIVSLFNAFGRLSNSIYELENFRRILR